MTQGHSIEHLRGQFPYLSMSIGGIVVPLDSSFQIIFKTDLTSQNQMNKFEPNNDASECMNE